MRRLEIANQKQWVFAKFITLIRDLVASFRRADEEEDEAQSSTFGRNSHGSLVIKPGKAHAWRARLCIPPID